MLQKPTVTTPNDKHRRHHRLSSSSEEADIPQASNNDWQVIHRTKRKKIYSPQPTVSNPLTETHNRYDIITQSANQDESGEQSLAPQNHKPPPIFIQGVIKYGEMVKRICEVAEDEQYYTKSLANNITKLNCTTPDTYRNLIKHFTENGIYYHTYQLKEERAYRAVLKYLHHSTDVEDIRQEKHDLGHKVRNIINVHHSITKEPLNLFFVDLESAGNTKNTYNGSTKQGYSNRTSHGKQEKHPTMRKMPTIRPHENLL
jgi:hypothetical protein